MNPIVLAGGGGGSLKAGRHVKFAEDISLANLFVAMLVQMDVRASKIGESSGRLEDV